jgi:hypothetical protein
MTANFTLTATSNQSVGIINIGGTQCAYIGGFSGSFQFTASGSGYDGRTDLLSGTFSSQTLVMGVEGGQSATFSDSTSTSSPMEVTLDSNVVAIDAKQENFSIGLSSVFDTQTGDAGFNVGGPGNTDVDNFVASGTGTFASDPAPIFAPEPTGLELITGGMFFVLLGAFRRKRQSR